MSRIPPESISAEKQDLASFPVPLRNAKSKLTQFAAWVDDQNIPFLISSVGMVVMLLWAGSYKMTAPGAEGIVPLVSNSPLVGWHFKLLALRCFLGVTQSVRFGHVIALRYACSRSNPA